MVLAGSHDRARPEIRDVDPTAERGTDLILATNRSAHVAGAHDAVVRVTANEAAPHAVNRIEALDKNLEFEKVG